LVWFLGKETGADEALTLRQLEHDSDRSVAIVAAALVEARLTESIQSRFHRHQSALDKLFHTSGPLGSFSAKIDLALLIGLVTKEAHCELVTLKKVRNAFAHDLSIQDFNSQRIRDLCMNLECFERYFIDHSEMHSPEELQRKFTEDFESYEKARAEGREPPKAPDAGFRLITPGFTELAKQPRHKYLFTAQMFSGYFNYLDRRLPGLLEPPAF
jgi:DNA-binding MltR family transcriptional regulator